MIRPLDTSTLGPICERPDANAARAKLVRDALIGATETDPSEEVSRRARWVAENASPVTLAKLGRML